MAATMVSLSSYRLLLFAVLLGSSGACHRRGKPFFGGNCDASKYMCHCRNIDNCHDFTGECTGGGCAKDYAGPACQYENLAQNAHVEDNFSIFDTDNLTRIVDGDPESCLLLEYSQSTQPLTLTLLQPSWVTSINILLSNNSSSDDISGVEALEVRYHQLGNDNSSFPLQPHLPKPNDTQQVIYYLPELARVTRVQFRALQKVSLLVCEVSVVGGRNLAVTQIINLGVWSSHHKKDQLESVKAVDGNTQFSEGSCFRTNGGGGGVPQTTVRSSTATMDSHLSSSRVTATGPQTSPQTGDSTASDGYPLVNVSEANEDSPSSSRVLIGKSRTITDSVAIGDPQTTTPAAIGDPQPWWRLTFGEAGHSKVWRVKIHNGRLEESHRGYAVNLTLTDGSNVTVYRHDESDPLENVTDIILQQAMTAVGITVWQEGSDRVLHFCEVEVLGDCGAGYYGSMCQTQCQCPDDAVCHTMFGTCILSRCRAGYTGRACEKVCNPGSYGLQCSNACSTGCVDAVCDHVTGHCTNGCLPEWKGKTCNETCPPGHYGADCHLQCNTHCLNITCDVSYGHCLAGCVEGFMGILCDTPINNEKANRGLGTIEGESDDSSASWTLSAGIIALGIAVFFIGVVVIFLWTQRNSSKRRERCGRDVDRSEMENGERAILMQFVDDGRGGSGGAGENEQTGVANPAAPLCWDNSVSDSTDSMQPRPLDTDTAHRKPQLLSLFSRDASMDPPRDVGKLTTPTNEKTPASRFLKEGPRSCSVQSSPRSQRGTPTQSRKMASFESLEALSVDSVNVSPAVTPPTSRRPTGDVSSKDEDNVDTYTTTPSTVIPLCRLADTVAQWLENPRHFSKERAMLPTGQQGDWRVATSQHNLPKNRYKDIFPYDHTRVLLTPLPGDPDTDFYNASYINGFHKDKEYIAAQGPTEKTVPDFLRLLWDVKCDRVVMLTNTVEMGRKKCHQYWPEEEGGQLTSGDITIGFESLERFADYCIRHLTLTREEECRPLTMYHYTSWPDNCAPASPCCFLHFRHKVRQGETVGPLVVHCSAGIGRTGTFLAIDMQLLRVQHQGDMDVFTCVLTLRQQRVNMVQTLAQYSFIYEALRASILTSPPLPVGEFRLDRVLNAENGVRLADTEYEKLQQLLLVPCDTDNTTDDSRPAGQLSTPNHYRVHIQNCDGTGNPASLNAVFLPSHTDADAFIQTNSPADEGGAVNFLSMLIQHNVTSVVCLDCQQADTLPYWPESEETVLHVPPYTITLLSMRETQGMTVRNLRITFPAHLSRNMAGSKGESESCQEVTQISCTTWPESRSTPPSVSVFLQCVNFALTQLSVGHPTVVHCRDGHSRSGLFCFAAVVLERMRVEGHVAVNYVTAHMRVPRPENIVHVDQYEFLYACAQQQLDEGEADVTPFRLKTAGHSRHHAYENVDITQQPTGACIPALQEQDGANTGDAEHVADETGQESPYGNPDPLVKQLSRNTDDTKGVNISRGESNNADSVLAADKVGESPYGNPDFAEKLESTDWNPGPDGEQKVNDLDTGGENPYTNLEPTAKEKLGSSETDNSESADGPTRLDCIVADAGERENPNRNVDFTVRL